MRFAILGAGALGTILGAHLVRAGHEVTMLARGARAKSLEREGLVVKAAFGAPPAAVWCPLAAPRGRAGTPCRRTCPGHRPRSALRPGRRRDANHPSTQ